MGSDKCKDEIVKWCNAHKSEIINKCIPPLSALEFAEIVKTSSWKRTDRYKDGNDIIRKFDCKALSYMSVKVVEDNNGNITQLIPDIFSSGSAGYIKNAESEEMKPPSEFYFEMDKTCDIPCFFIVEKDYYNKHGYLDDQCREDNVPLPPGFYDIAEAMFAYRGKIEAGRKLLLQAGFIEKKLSK